MFLVINISWQSVHIIDTKKSLFYRERLLRMELIVFYCDLVEILLQGILMVDVKKKVVPKNFI